MLYVLKHQKGPPIYYLINGREYIIGRKNADIVINDDQSISRKHAIIRVGGDFAKLVDCGSKYGTFHRGTKVEANTDTRIEDKDVIRFGVFGSSYNVEKMNLVTAGSGLNSAQREELKKNVELIGGTLVNNWDATCSYLTVSEILLTIKVLHALIDDKPIVTPDYWRGFVSSIRKKQPPPSVKDFKPPVAEVLLNEVNLQFNPKRKLLFKNKIFVFPTERAKSKMDGLIEKAGGVSVSWDQHPVTSSQITNSPDKYIFIRTEDLKQLPQSLKDAYQHVAKSGRKTIPIQEIAIAILHCSCEKNCNPNFKRVESVFMPVETNGGSQVFALAPETQSQDPKVEPKSEIIIPGSLSADLSDSDFAKPAPISTSQRSSASSSGSCQSAKRSVDGPQNNPGKKIKLDGVPTEDKSRQLSASGSKKRKADEDLSTSTLKKSSLRENPFASFKNRAVATKIASAVDNPFAVLRKQKDNTIDNPFKKLPEKSVDSVMQISASPITLSSSFVDDTRTSISEIKWLSKTNCYLESIQIEDEFQDIFDKFKNTVVIEILPVIRKRADIADQVDGFSRSVNGKNFKKFKKVRPVRPQITIISATVPQYPNARTTEVTVLSDGEEEEPPRPVVRGRKAGRFNF